MKKRIVVPKNNFDPALQSRIDAIIHAGTAASTRRAYVRDVRYVTA